MSDRRDDACEQRKQRAVGIAWEQAGRHRYPVSHGPLAQWQSCGLLIHRFGVRVPGGPPTSPLRTPVGLVAMVVPVSSVTMPAPDSGILNTGITSPFSLMRISATRASIA